MRERARLIRHEPHRLDEPAPLALGGVVVIVDELEQHPEIGSGAAGSQLQLPELCAERRMQILTVVGTRIRPHERRGLPRDYLLGLSERPHAPRV